MSVKAKPFATEADLCAAFVETLPQAWTAYPETAGWDLLLVHQSGWQIGIEAKLKLNAHVVVQALGRDAPRIGMGPDHRAVLVPDAEPNIAQLAARLGVQVITVEARPFGDRVRYGDANYGERWISKPQLPPDRSGHSWWQHEGGRWPDWAPVKRCALPEYVPDVAAGVAAPVTLSDWKIKAIRICILVERRTEISVEAFRYLQIDHRRWIDGHWLARTERRHVYVAGERFPAQGFRAQHPRVYGEIAAAFDQWAPLVPMSTPGLLTAGAM